MTTWDTALHNPKFECFEDPVTGTPMPKTEYNQLYGPACTDLFNNNDLIFVETFYLPNPVNKDCWMFVDEDAKADLFDTSVDLGLLPNLKEIQAGETKSEKSSRSNSREDRFIVVENMLNVPNISNKKRKKLTRELRGLKAVVEIN